MSRPISSESVFRALAHATRRRIVELLRNGPKPAGELIAASGVSQPSISEHLRILRDAGVVTYRRRRTSLVYQLNRNALGTAATWIGRHATSRDR